MTSEYFAVESLHVILKLVFNFHKIEFAYGMHVEKISLNSLYTKKWGDLKGFFSLLSSDLSLHNDYGHYGCYRSY